jgi:hypothetical protein
VNYSDIHEGDYYLKERNWYRRNHPEKIVAKALEVEAERQAQNQKEQYNNSLIAAEVAGLQTSCPVNIHFRDTGQYCNIFEKGVEMDLINFKDNMNIARVGYFSRAVAENQAMIQMRRLDPSGDDDLYFDNIKADTFMSSWEYKFPELRNDRPLAKNHRERVGKMCNFCMCK